MMKRWFFFAILFYQIVSIYAQNCDKYPITTKYDNFDSITANYKQLLLKDVEEDAVELPLFFTDMSKCWINRVKDYEVFQSYSITESAKNENPEIVFLVFNSRTLVSREEKQNWFNLMPMMNEEQLARLYDILEREMLKINAIELKYAAKKKEIRERYSTGSDDRMVVVPSDTTLQYLGYITTIDELSKKWKYETAYWRWSRGRFVNDEDEISEEVTFVVPDNMSFVKGKLDKNSQWIVDDYEKVFYSYMMNLKQGTGVMPTDAESQEYVIRWWNYLMEKYFNEQKDTELMNLASFAMEEHLENEQSKVTSLISRNYYLYAKSLKRGEYGEAAYYFANVIDNRGTDWSPQGFVSSLYVPVLCEEEKEWNDNGRNLEVAYVNWFHRMNKTDFYGKMNNYSTQTSIMLCDYYLQYGSNQELIGIIEAIAAKMRDQYTQGKLSYGEEDGLWYEFLNRSYLDGSFAQDYDYKTLEKKVIDEGFAANDAPMVEFICYYCLYQMIHNSPSKEGNVATLLRQIERICKNPQSSAFNYVEKYIAADLSFRLMSLSDALYLPPSIIVTTELPKETKEGSQLFSFVAGNGSASISMVKIAVNGKFNYNSKINKTDKRSWKFNDYIKLKKGENVIEIECLDTQGTKIVETFGVNYKPDDYRDRRDLAVLFAVNDYSHANGYNSLENPIKHAESLAKKLYEYGFDTVVYRDPNRQKIIQTLTSYASQNYGEYDQLLVFFAGHGKYDRLTGEGYIVPPSGDKDDPDGTMVTYHKIQKTLDNSNCRHVLFISDACHSGSFINEMRAEQPQGGQADIMKYKSRYFIGSATPEKTSPDDSELIKLLLQIFSNNTEEAIDFYRIQSLLKTDHGQEKVAGSWGSNEVNSDFYFNKRQQIKN